MQNVKTKMMLALGAMALGLGAMSTSVQAHSIQINNETISSTTLADGNYLYSFEVDLTAGNYLAPGAHLINDPMDPSDLYAGATVNDGVYLDNIVTGATNLKFVATGDFASTAGASLTPSFVGSAITLQYTGSVTYNFTHGAGGITAPDILGTFSFESALNGPLVAATYTDFDNGGTGIDSPETIYVPVTAGSPLATPLPAGFGSGLTGLAIVGLAAMKLRRKAAV